MDDTKKLAVLLKQRQDIIEELCEIRDLAQAEIPKLAEQLKAGQIDQVEYDTKMSGIARLLAKNAEILNAPHPIKFDS